MTTNFPNNKLFFYLNVKFYIISYNQRNGDVEKITGLPLFIGVIDCKIRTFVKYLTYDFFQINPKGFCFCTGRHDSNSSPSFNSTPYCCSDSVGKPEPGKLASRQVNISTQVLGAIYFICHKSQQHTRPATPARKSLEYVAVNYSQSSWHFSRLYGQGTTTCATIRLTTLVIEIKNFIFHCFSIIKTHINFTLKFPDSVQ